MKPLDLGLIEADEFEADIERVVACTARLRRHRACGWGSKLWHGGSCCRLPLFVGECDRVREARSKLAVPLLALAALIASFYFVAYSSHDGFLLDYGALE